MKSTWDRIRHYSRYIWKGLKNNNNLICFCLLWAIVDEFNFGIDVKLELFRIMASLWSFLCFWWVLQVLSTRIVAVKASLCKLSLATAARACDFYAKLLLIAISSTLKSLLRPHVLNTPDKSPGDRLSEICTKNTDTGNMFISVEQSVFWGQCAFLCWSKSAPL